jgi:type 2A phosphatase activator TIP41
MQKFIPSSTHSIPLQLLARQDPILDQILYYADVPLFEDELHDNGESILNARIVSFPLSALLSVSISESLRS